ncbi:MAG: anhydro-N-acetylmuramic acid kinase [Thioalkalispiraceae bacterium]|jgi:anhydro-N-acetylmuramic acid kinase
MDELYIGLMSGTSIDGIDACLVNLTDNQFKLLATDYQPYPKTVKRQLAEIISSQQLAMHNLAVLDHELAILNGEAVNSLLKSTKHKASDVLAIGYHGQTVFHEPDGNHPNSIQLGDANVLVDRTGITTVADFRRMDMAAGGQGAPLAPAFHEYLFRDKTEDRAILNTGGIANLTLLSADQSKPVIGFDTGPASCLMDEWCMLHRDQPYDKNGDWARQGKLNTRILAKLLTDPYFAKPPPKSTGREYFHLDWIKQLVDIDSVSSNDMLTTLTCLTATTITDALKQYAPATRKVFVCGGGVHNSFLLEQLKESLGDIELDSTTRLGLDPDWVEACAFAWLARQRLLDLPGNLPSVTGANKVVILGAIYRN